MNKLDKEYILEQLEDMEEAFDTIKHNLHCIATALRTPLEEVKE